MSSTDPIGADWTDGEVDLIVADYFAMLKRELAREPYVKAQHNAQLQTLVARTRGSIERKHQNISAVLEELGLPWIFGYKPLANYQNALIAGIERYLSATGFVWAVPEESLREAAEAPTLYVGPAPQLQVDTPKATSELRRLIAKFDPAARDARNRALGRRGEEMVFASEQARLRAAGRSDLARKVDWVSDRLGDGAGYDILSFSERGEERLLEVKTTLGHARTPFFLSANEHALSTEQPGHFRIFRLYDFAREPRAFKIAPPLGDALNLQTANYRASFR
ncbi:MAG TPA: DUF3883 domain-containing protein [Rhizomicrobium sp.]|jgi:hypothetical protein